MAYQEKLAEILTDLVDKSSSGMARSNATGVVESIIKARAAINALNADVIGSNTLLTLQDQPIKDGDKVMMDFNTYEKMIESSKFIEDNGKNVLRADLRKRFGIEEPNT